MMAGALKTLFLALKQSPFLVGNSVSLLFGNEEIGRQSVQRPYVVMVPAGGRFETPGYELAGDPSVEMRWETSEIIEFWLYNSSAKPQESGAVDHADAVDQLRAWLLAALQDQRAQIDSDGKVAGGLQYFVESGRWEVSQNAPSPFGRAYVLTVRVPITIALSAPPVATVQSEQFNYAVTHNPS
jgi:hypothetical protein